LALVLLIIMLIGQPARAQDPLSATVAALHTRVDALETTVARQATPISDSQTAVASSPTLDATPVAMPDPQSLEIQIVFRAKPSDIEADGEGEPCLGTGKFADVGETPDFAICIADEALRFAAEFTNSDLTRDGTIFSECTMTFLILGSPYRESYIIGITNRSVLTYDHADLEAMDWFLKVNFGRSNEKIL
jgi:hypothetical protein